MSEFQEKCKYWAAHLRGPDMRDRPIEEVAALLDRAAELEAERAALAATVARLKEGVQEIQSLLSPAVEDGDEQALEYATGMLEELRSHDAAYGARLLAAERLAHAEVALVDANDAYHLHCIRGGRHADQQPGWTARKADLDAVASLARDERLFALTAYRNAAAAEGADTEEAST